MLGINYCSDYCICCAKCNKQHLCLTVVIHLQQLKRTWKQQEHALRAALAIVFPLSLNLDFWKPASGN